MTGWQADLAGLDRALGLMGVGLFEWDASSKTYSFSARCRQIWGLPPQGVITHELLLARVHPQDMQAAAGVLAPDAPGRRLLEHRIMLPEGSIRRVQVAAQTVFEEGAGMRRALRAHGAMRDITQHTLTERQLSERTAQLSAFVQGAPVPLAMFDTGMRFLTVSQRYLDEWGLTAAQVIGRNVLEVFPHLPAHWVAANRRVLAGAAESSEGEPWVQPDGREEWFRWELRPWHDADGRVGGIILFAELITGRVRARQELRQSQARLELAREAGALGIYERSMTTGRITWDARVRELWGVGPDETVTVERVYQSIHPDDRGKVVRTVDDMARSPHGSILDLQYRIVGAGGQIRWIASAGRMFFADTVRTVGVVQDITERREAELALEQNVAQLRHAALRKDAYLAALSHELRNPLAPIRMAAHMLASGRLNAAQIERLAGVIHRQTRIMESLLADLADITRISRGRLVLQRGRVPLADIVAAALEPARPLMGERRHTLRVDLPRAVDLWADRERLPQALSRLLTDSVRLSDPGGRTELSATVQDPILVLHVRNAGGAAAQHGGGIAATPWPDQMEGPLSIGLALADGLVQLHGGALEVRRGAAGRGCDFILRLPLRQESASPQP